MSFYAGKKVFITGGSAGIGKALALDLAREGASVFISARGQARLDEAVAELRALGKPGQTFGAVAYDVSDAEAAQAGALKALEGLGGLDVLICNSGFAEIGQVHELPLEAYQRLLDVNYLGHVYTVRALAPHFIAQGSGHIALVSSMLGFFSTWGYGAYSASKYAIAGFAEALRQEMVRHGVKVTLFYPPTTETPGLAQENEGKHPVVAQLEMDNSFTWVHSPEEVSQVLLKTIRKGRFESYVGWDSWLVFKVFRHLPRLGRYLNDQELDTAFKKVEAKGRGA